MAGEFCGRACAWCGRCDTEPDFPCDCGHVDCLGDCSEPSTTNQGIDGIEIADMEVAS